MESEYMRIKEEAENEFKKIKNPVENNESYVKNAKEWILKFMKHDGEKEFLRHKNKLLASENENLRLSIEKELENCLAEANKPLKSSKLDNKKTFKIIEKGPGRFEELHAEIDKGIKAIAEKMRKIKKVNIQCLLYIESTLRRFERNIESHRSIQTGKRI